MLQKVDLRTFMFVFLIRNALLHASVNGERTRGKSGRSGFQERAPVRYSTAGAE